MWIIAIVVALAPAVSLGFTVWKNGLINVQKPDDVIVYTNSAVVAIGLDQFYDSKLKLSPILGIPLQDSVVGIYHFDSSCDHLPTENKIIQWHKSNVSGDQNYTHLYLLPGSTLNYTISPVSRNSVRVVHSIIGTEMQLDGELEKIKGYVYITRGPELQEFDPTNCRGTPDCNIEHEKQFTYNGSYNGSYKVDSMAYYNFHSAYDYRYTLDLAINAITVDLTQGDHVCNISDINEGERNCNQNFTFKANSLVCFVAHTEYEGNPYTILKVEITKQQWMIVVSVLSPAVWLFIVLCSILCFTCYRCSCRKQQNRYVPVNVTP